MRAHSENALVLAKWLAQRPEVDRVLYPGLTSHPSYALAQDLLDQSGGMLSFIVKGGDAIALSFARALKLALEASSLGGVETLVSLPFNTSHARLTPEQRLAVGIPPGFVRVSVGIEDVDDVIFDFQQALATSAG
jgi:cystathionine beta-lyase/cystathionine gamma-synthase